MVVKFLVRSHSKHKNCIKLRFFAHPVYSAKRKREFYSLKFFTADSPSAIALLCTRRCAVDDESEALYFFAIEWVSSMVRNQRGELLHIKNVLYIHTFSAVVE